MNAFVENPTDFAAECARLKGRCPVSRANFLFLDDGDELAAVDALQRKCGCVVITPAASSDRAFLYHTSCQRITDVLTQVFADALGAPASLPQATPEMTLGELQRRRVAASYAHCRAKVAAFSFK